jgi:hypothetical protein
MKKPKIDSKTWNIKKTMIKIFQKKDVFKLCIFHLLSNTHVGNSMQMEWSMKIKYDFHKSINKYEKKNNLA